MKKLFITKMISALLLGATISSTISTTTFADIKVKVVDKVVENKKESNKKEESPIEKLGITDASFDIDIVLTVDKDKKKKREVGSECPTEVSIKIVNNTNYAIRGGWVCFDNFMDDVEFHPATRENKITKENYWITFPNETLDCTALSGDTTGKIKKISLELIDNANNYHIINYDMEKGKFDLEGTWEMDARCIFANIGESSSEATKQYFEGLEVK